MRNYGLQLRDNYPARRGKSESECELRRRTASSTLDIKL
jgi:hypothetical protein